jgi:ethanolamine ammonia-lyase large subunit
MHGDRFLQYATEQNIIAEADEMGRILFLENKAFLAIFQRAALESAGLHRVDEMLMEKKALAQAKTYDKFTIEEARYYIKFAVAAYGENGIKSSRLDVRHGI